MPSYGPYYDDNGRQYRRYTDGSIQYLNLADKGAGSSGGFLRDSSGNILYDENALTYLGVRPEDSPYGLSSYSDDPSFVNYLARREYSPRYGDSYYGASPFSYLSDEDKEAYKERFLTRQKSYYDFYRYPVGGLVNDSSNPASIGYAWDKLTDWSWRTPVDADINGLHYSNTIGHDTAYLGNGNWAYPHPEGTPWTARELLGRAFNMPSHLSALSRNLGDDPSVSSKASFLWTYLPRIIDEPIARWIATDPDASKPLKLHYSNPLLKRQYFNSLDVTGEHGDISSLDWISNYLSHGVDKNGNVLYTIPHDTAFGYRDWEPESFGGKTVRMFGGMGTSLLANPSSWIKFMAVAGPLFKWVINPSTRAAGSAVLNTPIARSALLSTARGLSKTASFFDRHLPQKVADYFRPLLNKGHASLYNYYYNHPELVNVGDKNLVEAFQESPVYKDVSGQRFDAIDEEGFFVSGFHAPGTREQIYKLAPEGEYVPLTHAGEAVPPDLRHAGAIRSFINDHRVASPAGLVPEGVIAKDAFTIDPGYVKLYNDAHTFSTPLFENMTSEQANAMHDYLVSIGWPMETDAVRNFFFNTVPLNARAILTNPLWLYNLKHTYFPPPAPAPPESYAPQIDLNGKFRFENVPPALLNPNLPYIPE